MLTAFLPLIFGAIAGPTPGACVVDKKFAPDVVLGTGQSCLQAAESAQSTVVWVVGSITFGIGILASIVAFTTRETFRVHMNDLGNPDAVPVPKELYDQIRKTGVDQPVK
jgi:hypothetical protein